LILRASENQKPMKYLPALFCDPDWIQTNDLLLRRQLLYSAELPDLIKAGKDKGMRIKLK
jgi:hypothetical protein